VLLAAGNVYAADFDARLKWFSSTALLPDHDFQRQIDATPAHDYTADLRLMFRQRTGQFTWIAENATTINGGDSFGVLSAPGTTLDQTATNDDFRLVDLTWDIEDGSDHSTVSRFDRLMVKFQSGTWAVSVGRQAVSWGSGIVFQPMDLFNPFAPTTIDRDYKTGDDLLLVDKLLGNGSDLQLIAVGRRNEEENITGQAASVALKWHGFGGSGEWEVAAGKHYQDQVYAVSGRFPFGGALVRADIVGTRLRDGDWEFSGILNADYSVVWFEKNLYLFAEYYHNGFGVDELPPTPVLLPDDLRVRLQRGEVFTLMKDYLAGGVQIEWHPLWNQGITLISNLHDSSSILQTTLGYDPGDHSRLQFGLSAPLGRAGDEYGGVPLMGDDVTTGGARQLFLRYVYYF
jgi:hypothetical protein